MADCVDAYLSVFRSEAGQVVLKDLSDHYVRRLGGMADEPLLNQRYSGAEIAVARDAQRIVIESIIELVEHPERYRYEKVS